MSKNHKVSDFIPKFHVFERPVNAGEEQTYFFVLII